MGLETAWGLTGREIVATGVLSVAQAVHKLSVAPRSILSIELPSIEVGQKANLTIFDATTEWEFSAKDIKSKSTNTPFVGSKMVGKAWAVYNKGILVNNAAE